MRMKVPEAISVNVFSVQGTHQAGTGEARVCCMTAEKASFPPQQDDKISCGSIFLLNKSGRQI